MAETVAGHLKHVPASVRPTVQAARRTVKAVAPKATEIAYQSRPPRSRSAMWKIIRYVAHDAPRVDLLTQDQEPERDPNDRKQVRDRGSAGRAPVAEQPEEREVRETGAEDAEPNDRPDAGERRLDRPGMLDEDRDRPGNDHREGHLEHRRDHRWQPTDVAARVD